MTVDLCRQTCQTLRDNECTHVPDQCLDALLLWLCGGRNGAAKTVFNILGSPFDHPDILMRVYQALDHELLRDGDLVLPRGRSDLRHTRYRLLSRAFHPDRYPHMADWLSPRAQIINAAFSSFRKQKDGFAEAEMVAKTGPEKSSPPKRRESVRMSASVGLREWLISLAAPLAHSRYLPQKMLLLTALVCAFPVIYYYQQRNETVPYIHNWPDADTSVTAATDYSLALAPGPLITDTVTVADTVDRNVPDAAALAVVNKFRDSFEQGSLQELMRLTTGQPSENGNIGRSWLMNSYASLFEQTYQRSLQLEINHSNRDGDSIELTGNYAMHLVYQDGENISRSGSVQYRLVPEAGMLKISTIDYLP